MSIFIAKKVIDSPDILIIEDDNFEFQDRLEEELTATIDNDQNSNIALPKSKRDALRSKASESKLSAKQAAQFVAMVELDLLKKAEDQLGYERLFTVYCERGSRSWLNPLSGLGKLDEILRKFAASSTQRREIFNAFIELLINLANKDINPTAFLQYVMVTRLQRDNNWRKWLSTHLESLTLIGNILIEMREKNPFNKELLGSATSRLSRDIVLVKYVGMPLALFSENSLADKPSVARYIEAWSKLDMDNAFVILFMKTNILHFMYAMSGKIDFQQLILIIEQMPEIEAGFRENFPETLFNLDLNKINLNLFNYDIDASLDARKSKGYNSIDFVREIKAYLQIIIALLATNSGIHLCGYFARKLTVIKDPIIAGHLARLVEILSDRGGKHLYIWHAKKILGKRKTDHMDYLNFIEENEGCDPEYPRIEELFVLPEHTYYEQERIEEVAKSLDLPMEEIVAESQKRIGVRTKGSIESIQSRNHGISTGNKVVFKDLINVYIAHNPKSKPIIEKYLDDFIAGEDRAWGKDQLLEYDELGLSLHYPLLKMAIKTLASKKSQGFMELYKNFGVTVKQKLISIKNKFRLVVKEIKDIDKFKQEEVRKQINFQIIKYVWEGFEKQENNPDSFLAPINEYSMNLNKPMEVLNEQIMETEDKINNGDAEAEKLILKYRRALVVLQKQKKELEDVLDNFNKFSNDEKFLVALIVAGNKAKTGDAFFKALLAYLFNRYQQYPDIAQRLNYLREDISIDFITYKQYNYLLNILEVLFVYLNNDEKIISLLAVESRTSQIFSELLRPYFITKTKNISLEAVDAALKKVLSFNMLSAEKAKWQGIIEKVDADDERYYENYEMYTSKAPLDVYYGDMGSICLSGKPEAIAKPGFYNIRLVNNKEFMGMAIASFSKQCLASYSQDNTGFWHAFAFNPLRSLLNNMNQNQQLWIYLNFRLILEELAIKTKKPIVLAGIGNWGIVSNDSAFRDLIISFEKRFQPKYVKDAFGLELYYSEQQFAEGYVIIDPDKPETFLAKNLLKKYDSK